MDRPVDALSAREVLLALEENREAALVAGADLLALAAHWCDLHGETTYDDRGRVMAGAGRLVRLGGPGTPEVEEFAAAEFGAMRHLHPMAARNLMADALDLRHRTPWVWRAVHELRVEEWVARRIAQGTRPLTLEGAAFVDAALAPVLGTLPTGRLMALLEAKILEADPDQAETARRISEEARFVRSTPESDGLRTLVARAAAGDVTAFEAMVDRVADAIAGQTGEGEAATADVRRSQALGVLANPALALRMLMTDAGGDVPLELIEEQAPPSEAVLRALAPKVRLFVHVTDETLTGDGVVARVESLGPQLASQVREWLSGPCRPQVRVTGVLDLADQRPVDAYEFPQRLVEALHQLRPADSFPWSSAMGRRKDTDHPEPYQPPDRGGPPGQTGLHNGVRLTRHHHRVKTHGGWHLDQLGVGTYLWLSPHRFWFLVDAHGTRRLTESEVLTLRARSVCGTDRAGHAGRAGMALAT